MDIEKLIERLRNNNIENNCHDCALGYYAFEAATSLSTLRAENEKLKDQLYDGEGVNLVNYWMQQAKIEENGHRNCQAENEKLRAELEQVKAERDAAISDLETIMAYGGGNLDTCQYCKNGQCYARGGTKLCLPQWRGQKED